MAQFYASIKGNRGEATRLGTKSSGMQAHIRGWAVGAQVWMTVDDNGEDVVNIALTGGSNGSPAPVLLGTYKQTDLEKIHRLERG